MNRRVTLPIGRITDENADVRTFTFFHPLEARPGQFIMATDFKGGEKPFSLSDCREGEFSFTFKRVGEFTRRLFDCRKGDFISIRGAFGSSFFMSPRRPLLIGGGYGTPPLLFLARSLKARGVPVKMINAARSAGDLIMAPGFQDLGIDYREVTDDGSRGFRGSAVDALRHLQEEEPGTYDFVYAAGPEMMMFHLRPLLETVDYQFLFERYMKCAIGLCGSCAVDGTGLRICREGPALTKAQVAQLTEFGHYHRNSAGQKISCKTNKPLIMEDE